MLDPLATARLIREEWSRVVAVAMRILDDLDEAEDMAQEALLEAARHWPVDGVPASPGAWLTTVARNRALNRLRSRRRGGWPWLALDDNGNGQPVAVGADPTTGDPDGYGDDRLRLIVMCCHPCLRRDAQVALTLRLVGGLTAREIAASFVQTEATVAQRITRAKKRLRERGARFELPSVAELPARLDPVLEVIYLTFNEGYGPHAATEHRSRLCGEAEMLADQLTEIAPALPEVWGLAALIHFGTSRFPARAGASGELVPLDEQDRGRWDRAQVRSGERCLAAGRNAAAGTPAGPYLLQAEIAAQHARARTWEQTDWATVARLYAVLAERTGNPVVTLNWAIARSYTEGPAAALASVDALRATLDGYPYLTATRADLLRRAGQPRAAAALYRILVSGTTGDQLKAYYQRRLAECEHHQQQR